MQPSRWFIIQSDGSLLLNKNNTLLDGEDVVPLIPSFIRHFDLGAFEGSAFFCAEINQDCVTLNFFAQPLRKALCLLPAVYYGLGVKAYSVLNWDKNHQFCGRCGLQTSAVEDGFKRVCFSCQLNFFPRISPSVIVLIRKNNQVLMARSRHFLPGIYGLIAGFVEIGESLEDAVHREVQEEVGIKIKNLTYFGSQPWPFPDSLIVAYTADYAAGKIKIDQNEIVEAGWYTYDKLPGRPSMSISIATKLLDNFIQMQSKDL